MMKTTKMILTRIWWLGRGTATVMGLAMLLALTVGLASTALAGTGIGARFDLGKVNVINGATTALQGSGPSSGTGPLLEVKREGASTGSALRVENTNAQSFSPALQLKVPSGKIPMTVNSDSGTAVGLSADKLDGKQSHEFASATNGKANDADKLDGLDSSSYLKTFGKAFDAEQLDGKDSTAFVPAKTYNKAGNSVNHNVNISETVSASCDPGDLALSGGYGLAFAGGDTIRGERTEGSTYKVEFVGTGIIFTNVTCADLPPLR